MCIRDSSKATLEVVGRDQPDQRLYLSNDQESLVWDLDHAENELWKQPPEDVYKRQGYNPRIAVTVDMIATGTDVKPIECLIFMRDVRSKNYFEQMKEMCIRDSC